MKVYSVILFDLDGTLTDPGIGITNSVAYALQRYGIEVTDRSVFNSFVGPPLLNSFETICGFSKEQSQQAVGFYREYFEAHGMFENTVYDGIEDLLVNLNRAGKILALATSKPEAFAKRILTHFHLSQYFTFIAGGNFDGSRTRKEEVIRYALQSIQHMDPSDVIMVGDRAYDIIGANQTGIDSVGVSFGYGSREELEAANATFIADTVRALEEILFTKQE